MIPGPDPLPQVAETPSRLYAEREVFAGSTTGFGATTEALFMERQKLRRPLEDDLGHVDLVMAPAKSPLIASSRWV
jgi:hypothetical protein